MTNFFFFFFNYLFLAVLGLCCRAGSSRVAVRGLLTGVASLVVGLGLQDEQSSGVAVPPPWGTGSVVEPVEYVGSSWTRDQTQTCVSCIDRIFFFFFYQ